MFHLLADRKKEIHTAVSNILAGRVLVGPQYARIFTFSNHLLMILHAMYLLSNNVVSNEAM